MELYCLEQLEKATNCGYTWAEIWQKWELNPLSEVGHLPAIRDPLEHQCVSAEGSHH